MPISGSSKQQQNRLDLYNAIRTNQACKAIQQPVTFHKQKNLESVNWDSPTRSQQQLKRLNHTLQHMIRRAAYQEVIVVNSTLQQQSVSKRDSQTGTANESRGEIGAFKVPIHLVKRQRVVLIKDIKRIAPQLENVRTERGAVLFSSTVGGDILSSTLPSSQQQEPLFIPLPDDPDESVWYIHTVPTDATVVKGSSSQHIELELNPGIEKESITKKGEGLTLTLSAPPAAQMEGESSTTMSNQGFIEGESEKLEGEDHHQEPTRPRLSFSQSEHSAWSRSSMSSALEKLTTTATTAAPTSIPSSKYRHILSTPPASSSFTSARAVSEAAGVSPGVLHACTEECQQTTNTMRGQLLDLARALLSVLQDPEAIKNNGEEIERIRGMATNALKSCGAVELETEHHGLMTPEATPVLTPAIFGHIHRRSSGWSQCHGVSDTGNGNSREGRDHGQSQDQDPGHGFATLVLTNAMLPMDDCNIEHDQSIYDRSGTMLQDSVSHFSAYSLIFPADSMTVPDVGLSETPPFITTKDKSSSGSLAQSKSKSPFMAIFGKRNSAQGPLDDKKNGGVGSSSATTAVTKQSQRKEKGAKSMKGKWFKSKRRDTEGHAEKEKADQGTSTATAASGSGSESSASLSASVTMALEPGNLSASSSLSSSPPSGQLTTSLNILARSISSSAAPTTLLQPSQPPQRQQTCLLTTVSTGPVAHTATGSFFDSVSDDDSDSDEEEMLQRTQRTRARLTSQLEATGSTVRRPYQSRYQQQQYVQTPPMLQPYEQRHGQMRDRDVEMDRESDYGEHEEDNEREEDREDVLEPIRRHQHHNVTRPYSYTGQAQAFNPRTLQGYIHQFDDAPPPSYHSSIHGHGHGNDNDITVVSLLPPPSPVQYQRRLSSMSMPSSSWSPSPSSISLLQTLLDLLHQFEDHLLDHHKTPSFRSTDTTATTITTTNILNSGRQSWRSRHPHTIVSFAYVLIELEQTGILPSAMCAGWNGQSTTCISATASTNTPASAPSSPPPSPSPHSPTTPPSAVAEMSEQDWLAMTGNASTEMHLAKAMLVLERSCVHGMDLGRWRIRDTTTMTTVREEWIAKVQNIVA